jgi:hypothetical protein
MSYPEVPPTTTIFLPMSLSADLTILKVVIQTPEQKNSRFKETVAELERICLKVESGRRGRAWDVRCSVDSRLQSIIKRQGEIVENVEE